MMTNTTTAHTAGVKANTARRALLAQHGLHHAIPAGIAPESIREELARLDAIIAKSSAVTGIR